MKVNNAGLILATAIKSRKKENLLEDFITMYDTLKKAGINPILNQIDNKFSKELIEEIESKKLKYQIISPGYHREIAVKREIQTFKNHSISILDGCDPNYPKDQWNQLLPVAVITLNMLQPSSINANESTCNKLWGNFNFNKTPLAPQGCLIIAHERALEKERVTCANLEVKGYFLGLTKQHYQDYNVYIPASRGERIIDTIKLFPVHASMPKVSLEDRLGSVTEDLAAIL